MDVASHPCKSGRTASAQEGQEDGLGLIVGGVPGQRVGSDQPTTGVARSCLEVRTVGDAGVLTSERHAEFPGNPFGGRRVIVGTRAVTVVHVDGGDVEIGGEGQRHQGGRVGPARQPTDHRGRWTWKMAASQELAGERCCGGAQRSWWRRCLPPGYFLAWTLDM